MLKKIILVLSFIVVGSFINNTFASDDNIPTLTEAIEKEMSQLPLDSTPQVDVDWVINEVWFRIRGKVAFSLPPLSISVTPEIEFFLERSLK